MMTNGKELVNTNIKFNREDLDSIGFYIGYGDERASTLFTRTLRKLMLDFTPIHESYSPITVQHGDEENEISNLEIIFLPNGIYSKHVLTGHRFAELWGFSGKSEFHLLSQGYRNIKDFLYRHVRAGRLRSDSFDEIIAVISSYDQKGRMELYENYLEYMGKK